MTRYAEAYDGAQLHYQVEDCRQPWLHDGASIVFHHGVGACADIWRGWLPALISRYRVIRFDMRGHGRSQPAGHYQWTLQSMMADLDAVIDASCEAPVHLVGESVGGTIALAFAMTNPDKVRTLTISNGAHRGTSISNLQDWEEQMGQGGMTAWSAMMMERRFYRGSISRAAWNWFETQQASADAQAVMAAVHVLVGVDLSANLDRVSMPTLLLHPDASPFIPVQIMAQLRDKLPNAHLAVFAHAKHGLPFSHPIQCAEALANFLAEHS